MFVLEVMGEWFPAYEWAPTAPNLLPQSAAKSDHFEAGSPVTITWTLYFLAHIREGLSDIIKPPMYRSALPNCGLCVDEGLPNKVSDLVSVCHHKTNNQSQTRASRRTYTITGILLHRLPLPSRLLKTGSASYRARVRQPFEHVVRLALEHGFARRSSMWSDQTLD